MLKHKNQKWQKQIRSKHIQTIKTKSRQKSFLIIRIEMILSDYSKCSLVSGKNQLMDHQSHFDCQSFIVQAHQQMYRYILQIGVQNCKEFLLEHHLPTMLYEVVNRIQDAMVDKDDKIIVKQSKSRARVIKSVTDLLCMFSQDLELFDEFNLKQTSKAVDLLFDELRDDFPNLRMAQKKWIRPTAALINLFHDDVKYEEIVYQTLVGGNFSYIIKQYCSYFIKNNAILLDSDLQNNLITLYSYYLQYQQKKVGQAIVQKQFLQPISKFIIRVIQKNMNENNFKKNRDNKLIDNILDLCFYIPLNKEDCLTIVRNKYLYSKNPFGKILMNWSERCPFLTLSVFSEQQINGLLYVVKDLSLSQKYKTYTSNFICSFINLIQKDVSEQEQTIRFWRCLQQTNTLSLVYNHSSEQAVYHELTHLLELYCPDQL